MLRYVLNRLLSLLVSLLIASAVIFAIVDLVPGDPASFILGTGARPETLAALTEQLGLDHPWPERFLGWLGAALHGDLGTSFTYKAPVAGLIADRIAVSLPLAIMALILSVTIALPVAMIAAARHGRPVDLGIMGAAQIGIALPNFWFAMMLVAIFAIKLRWLPSGGFPGWEHPLQALKSLLLPAIALALPQAAILARTLRSSLIATLGQDYIRTARAKGLSRYGAMRRHALRNALIPVMTILGLQFSFLLAGSIIIENVFYLPGLGRLIFQAINQRDLITVQGAVLILVLAVIIVNFLTDLAYAAIDPRLRSK